MTGRVQVDLSGLTALITGGSRGIGRAIALELARAGARVALNYLRNREEMLAFSRKHTPLGRLASPEDVARVVLWLASDQAEMIHGQTTVVDGGYSIVAWP